MALTPQINLNLDDDPEVPSTHCAYHAHQVLLTDNSTGEKVCPCCLGNRKIFTTPTSAPPRFLREVAATGNKDLIYRHCRGERF